MPKANKRDKVRRAFEEAIRHTCKGASQKAACNLAKISPRVFRFYLDGRDPKHMTPLEIAQTNFSAIGRPELLCDEELSTLDAIISIHLGRGKSVTKEDFRMLFVEVRRFYWEHTFPNEPMPKERTVPPTEKTITKYCKRLSIVLRTVEKSPAQKVRSMAAKQRYSMNRFFDLVEYVNKKYKVLSV
jgi:hypothetical protein